MCVLTGEFAPTRSVIVRVSHKTLGHSIFTAQPTQIVY